MAVTEREFMDLLKTVAVMQANLDAHAKALEVARADMDRRLEGMNKFREENVADKALLMTRAEWTAGHEGLMAKTDEKFLSMNSKLDTIQRFVWIGIGVTLAVSALIGVVMHYVGPAKSIP